MHTLLLVCVSILVILTLALGFLTSLVRGGSKTIYYNAPLDPASMMAKAQRAHGNAAEYAALLGVLFIATGFAYAGRDLGLFVTSLVIALTAARVVHAAGFLVCKTLEKPHLFKAVGALVTYLGGIALAGLVLSRAL